MQNVLFILLSQYSLIAAVGLVEDNAVVLVASMLVSPLMVIAFIKYYIFLLILFNFQQSLISDFLNNFSINVIIFF